MSGYILGISAFYHDSAAALVHNGLVVAAAQEERFTRIKHTAQFPANAILYCLEEAGISIVEVDAVVFYDKPLLKFQRLLETFYAFAPVGLTQFVHAMPLWSREKLFLKSIITKELSKATGQNTRGLKLLFTDHHQAHAASAFYPSPFENAAVLTIDGVGEWCTASIGEGHGHRLRLVREMHFPHSVGLLYSAFTYYLGFKVNSGEYKLMGLAPFGAHHSNEVIRFKKLILSELVDVFYDGSIRLNMRYFNFATGLTMTHNNRWKTLFGLAKRTESDPIEQAHCNLALAIQEITELIVLRMTTEAKRLTGAENLCMAGGVALNCVANGKLIESGLFNQIFIQPASGDAGGALGAALAAAHQYQGQLRQLPAQPDSLNGAQLGPGFDESTIAKFNSAHNVVAQRAANQHDLVVKTAELLTNGMAVGWFQGRMEFGPRALGNRSILADPRQPDMQQKLNLKVKGREGFRPFAPVVTAEAASRYFNMHGTSPYMLLTAQVRAEWRANLADDFENWSWPEKLRSNKGTFNAITHVDGSARVQTVDAATNATLHALLQEFERISGHPILINTSFNVRGEPPVCTPFDAYRCFMATGLDALIMGPFIYLKNQQPDATNTEKWLSTFEPD